MLKFILIRFLQALPVLWVIITATFFMARLAPGGPFDEERNVSESIKEAMEAQYGLNDPLMIQYLRYLRDVVPKRFLPHRLVTAQGIDLKAGFGIDFGPSFSSPGNTINQIMAEKIPVSLELGGWALLFALAIGIPVGMTAALKQNSPLDYVPMTGAMIGICLPTFVVGPLLVLVFGLNLQWFDVFGWSHPRDRILPAVTLGLAYAAYIARLTRGGMLEILSQDYIRTARAKGVSETGVILRHAMKGGLSPVVSYLGPAFAGLLSGSFVVENIFTIPGLGRAFVESALNRDYTLVMGTVIFYATLLILMNLLVDCLQVLLNPKLKFGD